VNGGEKGRVGRTWLDIRESKGDLRGGMFHGKGKARTPPSWKKKKGKVFINSNKRFYPNPPQEVERKERSKEKRVLIETGGRGKKRLK